MSEKKKYNDSLYNFLLSYKEDYSLEEEEIEMVYRYIKKNHVKSIRLEDVITKITGKVNIKEAEEWKDLESYFLSLPC